MTVLTMLFVFDYLAIFRIFVVLAENFVGLFLSFD